MPVYGLLKIIMFHLVEENEMIKYQFAAFKENIDSIQIQSVFIHNTGKVLCDIHICIKVVEQDALCSRGEIGDKVKESCFFDVLIDVKYCHFICCLFL